MNCISFVFLLFASCLFGLSASLFPDSNPNFIGTAFGVPGKNVSFDYVVIGGGTAGITLATRLAQNGTFSVALVEAGSFYEISNGNHSAVPSGDIFFIGSSPQDYNPLVDWEIVTTPQAGLKGRNLHYARGKCLGGSSARNFFIYHFATIDSYTKWAEEVGDESYQFDSFLGYHQRCVDFTQANNAKRASNASYEYNGTNIMPSGNPLHVTLPNYASAFGSWFLQGLASIGIPVTSDFISGRLAGGNYAMLTLDPRDMSRSSAEASYWRVALTTTSLTTYQSTLAKKILFSGTRASGVVVDSQGLKYTLSANKEVIVSTGAFQSPQLLMVSGIGPAQTLSSLGIPLVKNLSGVGQNLQDHVFYGPSYRVNVLTHSSLNNPAFVVAATQAYLANQEGIVGNPAGDVISFEKTPGNLSTATEAALNASFPPDWPAVEYIMLDGYGGNNSNYVLEAPQDSYQYVAVFTALVAPLSRGNVSISSPDTADRPVVNPNWFTHPADVEVGIAAFRRIRQLMATDTMRNITIGSEVYPGFANVSSASDEQIELFIRETGTTLYHAAASCKMGKEEDEMAVVDARARVFGVQGLRVVDAAAFPFLPPGHPQSTVYALAEKIAEDVLMGG